MLNPDDVPKVGSGELLARYVLAKKHFRRKSQTLKPDAFMPHPYDELSVTRHLEITNGELWDIGKKITAAMEPPRTLYGRGDVLSSTFLGQNLKVLADPVKGNPNHANVTGWPPANDKSAQKLVATEIAAVAKFVVTPGLVD